MGIIVPEYYLEQFGVSISNVYVAFSTNDVFYDAKMKIVSIPCNVWKNYQARLDGERIMTKIGVRVKVNDISESYTAGYTQLKTMYPDAIDQQ